ncbi:MAG: hypothetical protein LBL34_01420 [Clostridiales bacterium]|jgi:hypothetical protein|nr:hypothetical protein [Clostridiales bacterium]
MIKERYMVTARSLECENKGELLQGYYVHYDSGRVIEVCGKDGIVLRNETYGVDPDTIEPVAVKVVKKQCSEGDTDMAHTYFNNIFCPNCGERLIDDADKKYLLAFAEANPCCRRCGQRLDWSEDNETAE